MCVKITGVFPALTTPFLDGRLSVDNMISNVKKFNAVGFAGYLVLGSTGESVLLSEKERLTAIESVSGNAADGKVIIAGTGMQSTTATIDFTNLAAESGAEIGLVVSPFYYKGAMTGPNLEKYYREVADNSRIPVMLYNVPKFTGLSIPVDTIVSLSEHPNIVGIKDSSADLNYHSMIIHSCSNEFVVLQGGGAVLYPSLILGASGAILALSNFASKETVAIFDLFNQGELEKARAIQMKLVKVNQKIVGAFGVAGIKYALDLCGYYGGDPRPPLQTANDEVKSAITNLLDEAEII